MTTALAPRARARKTSAPVRTPLSSRTGTWPATAATISGRTPREAGGRSTWLAAAVVGDQDRGRARGEGSLGGLRGEDALGDPRHPVAGGRLGELGPGPRGNHPGAEGGRDVRRAVVYDVAAPDGRVRVEARHP